jgi:transposase-like protein
MLGPALYDKCPSGTIPKPGKDAIVSQFLKKLKALGLHVTAAFSDYSQSFTEAIKAVYPHARFQADHFHTVKNIWGHLKKSLLSYRRQVKANGAAQQDEACMTLAKQLWTLDIISNKKLDQKVVEFLHRQDYSLVENLIYRSPFLLKAY